jgi:molybdate transport repressor ModE-like protein
MEFRHIRLLCLILEQGSISAAARSVGLGQPTVSQHLRSLEKELGILLFERRGRRVVPTEAAVLFHPYARQAIQALEAGRQALDEHLGLVRGRLNLAGSTIPGHYILPSLMARFHRSFPGVEMRLQVGDTEWVVERVRAADVELGFVGAKLEGKALSFEPFAEDELALVVAPGHALGGKPLSLDELREVPLVSREQGSGTRRSWEEHLRETGFPLDELRIVAEFGSTEAVIRAVKAGMGAGVVSMRAAEAELARGELERVQLALGRMGRTFYLVRHLSRPLSPSAQKFLELAMEWTTMGNLP